MRNAQQEWISTPEAAEILSRNSRHAVSREYVIRLINLGKLEAWKVNAHAFLVKRASVENYRVKAQKQPV